ncbi:MAG: alpha/beta hydrolase-fold protein [Gemmatimonadota bacterium]
MDRKNLAALPSWRLAALLLLPAGPALAQGAVPIPGSERYTILSSTNGVEYQIDVALPSGYGKTDKRYPAFYVLDGNLAFASLADAYRDLRIDGSIPELILVGIGYAEDDPAVYTPSYHASRSRDYTPTDVETAIPGSGKGRAFLTFIKDELIPFVDRRWRTDPKDRGLGGHSLGGLFTTYTLLTEPSLFNRYWIGSPSLWWDKEVSFSWVKPALERADKPNGRAFLTVGGLETDLMVSPMRRMAARLAASFPALETNSIVFPDETHMSVPGGSISRALRVLYGKKAIPLGAAQMAEYAGRWKSASGETMPIAVVGNRLVTTVTPYGATVKVDLSAESKDHLFSKQFNMDLVFERDPSGRVVRLRRMFTGQEVLFEKDAKVVRR